MIKKKKIIVWSHYDLDGIVSYFVVKWTFPKEEVSIELTTLQGFRDNFTKWLVNNNLEDYDKVFIMDMCLVEHKDLIDHKNVFIIDHHPEHSKDDYKKANSIIKEYTSASKLAMKAFKELYNLKLTKEQLALIALTDDYDSYSLKSPLSSKLNVVWWDTTNKIGDFTKSFGNGFYGFNEYQLNILKLHDLKLEDIKKSMKVYVGDVKIQGKERHVCAVFATKYINEIADILLKDYKAEIAIVVNTNTNHISFRKSSEDLDLSLFAKTIANGGGHDYASGGEITDNFKMFTTLLKEI